MADVLQRLRDSLADRYRIERELGRGGMATVYLADDLKHGRKVAIKLLMPEIAQAIGTERFLVEIEVPARLTHPHILPLFDSGTASESLYYVMPFIEGESLRVRLNREKQLPLDVTHRLTREIASALGHAHQHGLVHRDVKPENILLSDGMALVADFGIVRRTGAPGARGEEHATRAWTGLGIAVGTPRYMSPEQACGGDVDGRSDLYVLTCLFYEMLAGRPPFTSPTASGVMRQHLTEEPPSILELCPSLPRGIEDFVAKSLAKDPRDRYPTAAHFAEALAVAVAGTSVSTPLARSTPAPGNLPRPRSRFIGREAELNECAPWLHDHRLLTLTGIGGCGKTRLAIRLAESLRDSFADGVWFVELAPLKDPGRVLPALAATLGVRESPGVPLLENLLEHLRERRALIVLDNCEHVLSACAELADTILASCEAVKLLATSREGLGIEGEHSTAVRSLSLPTTQLNGDLRAIEASEAVQLFIDRARAVDPDFAITPGSAPAVADLCRQLDGIPLAIELAAARVRLLSVEEICARLDDRFRLLTGGSKTALPHHQTLRATMQWSYDLLSEREQSLLRLLSVFAGGWTLAAATRIAWAGGDEFELLELLEHLVNKSLVLIQRVSDGTIRYTMLETVRQYAQERLNESGGGEAARSRHLDYLVGFVATASPQLNLPEEALRLARLDQEHENLLSALAWAPHAEGDPDQGFRLLAVAWPYWRRRGFFELGYQVSRQLLDRTKGAARTSDHSLASYVAGALAYFRGEYGEARGHAEESLGTAKTLADPIGIVRALTLLSIVAGAEEDYSRARAHGEQGLVLARTVGDERWLSTALNGLAEILRLDGELDRAALLYEEALALTRRRGDADNTAAILLNLSRVAIRRGNLDLAREQLMEVAAIAEAVGSKVRTQGSLDVAAALACAWAEDERAARIWGAAEKAREQMGLRRDPVDEKFITTWIQGACERLQDGRFKAAEASGRALTHSEAMGEVRAWLGARTARDPLPPAPD